MIFKLNQKTGEITEVSADEARRALIAYGWTSWSISDFFQSAKVLCDSTGYYSRFKNRLEELRPTERSVLTDEQFNLMTL